MPQYEINKGIGETVEFKGLKQQYLFIFAGGLLSIFGLFVGMYLSGVGQLFCLCFCFCCAMALVWLTFRLNARYGSHGLMKRMARRQHPRRIISRKPISQLITPSYAKHTENLHPGA